MKGTVVFDAAAVTKFPVRIADQILSYQNMRRSNCASVESVHCGSYDMYVCMCSTYTIHLTR